jgi:hypothetical protein
MVLKIAIWRSPMKIKVQVIIESEGGTTETVEDITLLSVVLSGPLAWG